MTTNKGLTKTPVLGRFEQFRGCVVRPEYNDRYELHRREEQGRGLAAALAHPGDRRGRSEGHLRRTRSSRWRSPQRKGRPGWPFADDRHPRRHHRREPRSSGGARRSRRDGTITRLRALQISRRPRVRGRDYKAKAERRCPCVRRDRRATCGARAGRGLGSTARQRPSRKACAKEHRGQPADLGGDLIVINERVAAGRGSCRGAQAGHGRGEVQRQRRPTRWATRLQSGARIPLHLALELKRRRGGTGRVARPVARGVAAWRTPHRWESPPP
jgi:hypothetical protein